QLNERFKFDLLLAAFTPLTNVRPEVHNIDRVAGRTGRLHLLTFTVAHLAHGVHDGTDAAADFFACVNLELARRALPKSLPTLDRLFYSGENDLVFRLEVAPLLLHRLVQMVY